MAKLFKCWYLLCICKFFIVLISIFKIEMKLNKGTIPVTINLIYLGRSKSVGQLKAPYTNNILLIVKAFTYVCVNQCRNDGLGPSILIGISFYIHFRQLTLMGLFIFSFVRKTREETEVDLLYYWWMTRVEQPFLALFCYVHAHFGPKQELISSRA